MQSLCALAALVADPYRYRPGKVGTLWADRDGKCVCGSELWQIPAPQLSHSYTVISLSVSLQLGTVSPVVRVLAINCL